MSTLPAALWWQHPLLLLSSQIAEREQGTAAWTQTGHCSRHSNDLKDNRNHFRNVRENTLGPQRLTADWWGAHISKQFLMYNIFNHIYFKNLFIGDMRGDVLMLKAKGDKSGGAIGPLPTPIFQWPLPFMRSPSPLLTIPFPGQSKETLNSVRVEEGFNCWLQT